MPPTTLYYHVRFPNGVTLDWHLTRAEGVSDANKNGAQCFEVNSVTGRAHRIA